jgi:hypothetical protein
MYSSTNLCNAKLSIPVVPAAFIGLILDTEADNHREFIFEPARLLNSNLTEQPTKRFETENKRTLSRRSEKVITPSRSQIHHHQIGTRIQN